MTASSKSPKTRQRRLVLAAFAAAIAGSSAAPASAALFRRNSDGQALINPLLCQTDYEIRQALAQAGYTHVSLNAPIESHIQARGTKGGATYLIDYNFCFGYIASVQRLR